MKFPYSIQELEKLYQDGYLAKQKHPTLDLWIYNYSQKCQFEQLWSPITKLCRGLVLDAEYNILARPIPKFFNIEEHKPEEIPDESYEITEKKDGSLIQIAWVNDEMIVSSRGSFTSDHAVKAREIIEKKYKKIINAYKLDGLNLVFELVAKFNKIVVDYGNIEDLFLITAIENDTGEEVPYEMLEDFGFPIVKRYKNLKISELKALNTDNEEGFVVKFKSGMRIKIKFEDYVRLHRIVTNVSTKTIWEHLKDNKSLEDLLNNVPDEFFKWVKFTIKKFENQYKEIEDQCKKDFKILETRKECALYYQTKKYPSILFKMMEDKSYDQIIWKIIRPKYEKPFKIEE
ncbi:MAG: hypothetical protein H8E98_04525 [Bacteroidetes bacterium]|nr:hypothetical protein [Bacteroidota bacterium]